MALILPDNILPASAEARPTVRHTAEIDREIDTIVNRLLAIGLRRCCSDFQTAAREFLAKKTSLQRKGPYAYLDDPYLRTLAIAGEEHLCHERSRRELETLFALRETMMACDVALVAR